MTSVSICIPVYNGALHIAEAIASVLEQSYKDLEVVVVDNCSTDGTVDVVRGIGDPRVRLLENNENIGAIPNWNRAIRESTGEFIKLLCADDVVYPGVIAAQVEALSAADGITLVSGRRDVIDAGGRVLMRSHGLGGLRGRISGSKAIKSTVRFGGNLIGEPFAVMMPRRVVDSVGDFADSEPYLVDLDYWFRALRIGDLYAMEMTVGGFRISDETWTSALAREQGRQSRAFFRRSAEESPVLRRSDLVAGVVKSTVRSVLRRGFLAWHSRRRRAQVAS